MASTAIEDENEVDELANIPKEHKTKQGYLKDGFVVDSDCDENSDDFETDDDDSDCKNSDNDEVEEKENDLLVEDIGSELSEDKYDYSTDESK